MRVRAAVGSLLLTWVSQPCLAQAPLGTEFVLAPAAVRTASTGLATGFLAVWNDAGGIGGRRYAANGSPVGAEFVVSTSTSDTLETVAAIDAGPSGSFVVAYSTRPSASRTNIVARRFDPAGAPLGSEIAVSVATTGHQRMGSVAVLDDGSFVVAWDTVSGGPNLQARRFLPDGTPAGPPFDVNTMPASNHLDPMAVAAPGGGFLIVWAADFDILARRFAGDGQPVGVEFRVNGYTSDDQSAPAAAFDADGRLVVVWQDAVSEPNGIDVRAQVFAADGSRSGAEFTVNRTTLYHQFQPTAAPEADGRFLVVWTGSIVPQVQSALFGQLVDDHGRFVGAEFQVNSAAPPAYAFDPKASASGDGRILVAWLGLDDAMAQVLGGMRPTALTVDTAGNGVADPGESAIVAPTWLSTLGTAADVTSTATSFTGPAGGTYTIDDGAAAYGTIADRGTASCGSNCLAVTAAGTRPATHWDPLLRETLSTGHHFDFRIHIGGSFADVPPTDIYYRFVETLLHNRVTAGCGAGVYCPHDFVTRQEMAVFALVGKESINYGPPACTAAPFGDVPADYPYCRWIQELAGRGVVAGCGGGNYCPLAPVTREQMAVFTLKTLDPALVPPACAPPNTFADVPEGSPFCRWIEELARRGVVAGCGGGNYCPQARVTRGEMAVFITATFGLTLYGI